MTCWATNITVELIAHSTLLPRSLQSGCLACGRWNDAILSYSSWKESAEEGGIMERMLENLNDDVHAQFKYGGR